MSNHLSRIRTVAIAGAAAIAAIAAVGAATMPAAHAEPAEQLSWVRVNACSRAERSTGHVDVDGECLRDDPAFESEITVCAGHFCPARPGRPGARIIHPSDFGPTT